MLMLCKIDISCTVLYYIWNNKKGRQAMSRDRNRSRNGSRLRLSRQQAGTLRRNEKGRAEKMRKKENKNKTGRVSYRMALLTALCAVQCLKLQS